PLTSDHPHVSRLCPHRPRQHAHILFVSACHNHQVARSIRLQLLERLVITRVNLLRHRKPLRVRERLAVIHHSHAKPRRLRRLRHRRRNVSASKQVHHRLRQYRLHENLYRAPANQPVVIPSFIVQVEHQLPRRLLLHHLFCRRPYVRFHTPPANRSCNRPARMHNSSQRPAQPRPPHPHYLFKQIHCFASSLPCSQS